MSGHGGIPYGDRPIVRDGFATPEFLRFLEQLNKTAKGATTGGTGLQTQITANATDIDTLQGQVVTLNSQIAGAQTTAGDLQLQVAALGNRVPVETALAASGAITLVSATPTELVQVPVAAGLRLVVGMVYLTGGGSVTTARASVGVTSATIETDPGSFATGWFGAGASPASLGMDLSVGSFVRVLNVVHVPSVPTTLYLNVRATLSGTIGAYGSLIVWQLGA